MDYSILGNKLKIARENKKITQKYVSDLLKVTPQTVSTWETGKNKIDIESLSKLCVLYDVSISSILQSSLGDAAEADSTTSPEFVFAPPLNEHETHVMIQYRNMPEMQPAVDTLLKVVETIKQPDKVVQIPEKKKKTVLSIAGYGGGLDQIETDLTKEEILEYFHKMKNLDKI